MDLLQSVLLVGILSIISAEWILWRIFRKRIEGLLFPHEIDTSSIRFFTLIRIRFCSLLHTILLLIAFCLPLFFLW